jgi:hypothetical protein
MKERRNKQKERTFPVCLGVFPACLDLVTVSWTFPSPNVSRYCCSMSRTCPSVLVLLSVSRTCFSVSWCGYSVLYFPQSQCVLLLLQHFLDLSQCLDVKRVLDLSQCLGVVKRV